MIWFIGIYLWCSLAFGVDEWLEEPEVSWRWRALAALIWPIVPLLGVFCYLTGMTKPGGKLT